jgi:hypothetical protein
MRENLIDGSHKMIGFAVGKHVSGGGVCNAAMCLEFIEQYDVNVNINPFDIIHMFLL